MTTCVYYEMEEVTADDFARGSAAAAPDALHLRWADAPWPADASADVATATVPSPTSADFRTWTVPELLKFPDAPDEPMYTNQVQPYFRAPHLFVGFPTRYSERQQGPSLRALPDPSHRQNRMKSPPRFGTAVTDGVFMTSRDGRTFRRWDEAFLRPGPERRHNWLYGDGYQHLGLLETATLHGRIRDVPERLLNVEQACCYRS